MTGWKPFEVFFLNAKKELEIMLPDTEKLVTYRVRPLFRNRLGVKLMDLNEQNQADNVRARVEVCSG
jgi:hypothetical protein